MLSAWPHGSILSVAAPAAPPELECPMSRADRCLGEQSKKRLLEKTPAALGVSLTRSCVWGQIGQSSGFLGFAVCPSLSSPPCHSRARHSGQHSETRSFCSRWCERACACLLLFHLKPCGVYCQILSLIQQTQSELTR